MADINSISPIVPTSNYVAGQEFTFDANQYLPQIQQQASAIYNPQKAQLEALRQIGEQQTQQTRIVTEEDFAKRMKQEREAINQRGAFFSGGAITNEQGIRTEQARALNSINLQAQMDTINNLAQQGQISVAQAQYIQDQLSGAKSSAYGMWSDAYNRDYQKKQDDRQYKLQKKASKGDNGRGGLSKREYAKLVSSEAGTTSKKTTSTKKTTKKTNSSKRSA
jgi:hypothetical protein